MTKQFTDLDLFNGIHGDLAAFSCLLQQEHSTLENLASMLPQLIVYRTDVQKVLQDLIQRRATPQLVQQWASFVRRGYIANEAGRASRTSQTIKPIQIEYDSSTEDVIVEVI